MSAEKLAKALRWWLSEEDHVDFGEWVEEGIQFARAALAAHEAEAKAATVKESLTPAPLTDEQIKRLKPVCADFVSFRAGVRAMEALQANGGKA